MDDQCPRPLLSIIIPNYNNSENLDFLLTDIAEEITRERIPAGDIEVIVKDGGSGDNFLSVVEKHANIISFWSSAPDDGQADAIQTGFADASGEWLLWQNSDDRFIKHWSKILVKLRSSKFQKKYDVVLGGTLHCRLSDQRIYKLIPAIQPRLNRIKFMHELPNQSTFFNANLKPHSLMDKTFNFCMDFDLAAKILAQNSRIYSTKQLIGIYVDRPDNKTNTLQYVHDKERRTVVSTNGTPLQRRWLVKLLRFLGVFRPAPMLQALTHYPISTRPRYLSNYVWKV